MEKIKTLQIKDINVMIIKKPIKNLHLSVLPPEGKVRISAPSSLSDEIIKAFIIKKYGWIKKHINSFKNQPRQNPREFVSGESHYLRGKRYIMKVIPSKKPAIEIKNKKFIYFYVPDDYSLEQKEKYYENWLRKELRKDLNILIPKWEKIMNLKAKEVKIKKMKTKWGSCNPEAKRIWINLELIKKPQKHLEYVIVHEFAHFIEKRHNDIFKAILDTYMPKWKIYKKELNEFII